jgi:hypothetical protein
MAEGQSNAEQYKEIEVKVNANKIAIKTAKDIKKIKEKTKKGVANYNQKGNSIENNLKQKIDNYSTGFVNKKKQFKSQGKNQLESLIDLFKTTLVTSGGTSTGGTEVISVVRDIFVKTTNRSASRIKQLLSQEMITSLGCSQEQEYIAKDLYIKVSSIDIFGDTLKNSPDQAPGSYLYENYNFNTNKTPRAFNKELYHRIQNKGISYFQEYNVNYLGVTNQSLFDITYVTNSGTTTGDFYKVNLTNRQTGNKVSDFLGDYLDTIDVINLNDVYKNVLDLLTGSISFSLKFGDDKLRDQKKFEKVIQRILGMCFDNKTEIDVSGVGKLDQLDQIDDDFLSLDEIDNIEIENTIKNILSGVVEYQDCGSIKLPISSPLITELLSNLNQSNLSPSDYDFLGVNMLNTLSDNPEWKLTFPNLPPLKDVINTEYLKIIPIAIVYSLLSPKHLFPLFVMKKSLGDSLSDDIDSLEDFMVLYKKYLINLTSKILAIFTEELVKEIKKSINRLVQDLVNQELNELITKRGKTVQSVLLLINASLTVLNAVSDYRRCKSIIDELQRLLQIGIRLSTLQGAQIPPLINYFAFLKPGMTSTSILRRTIERMDEVGVPTGDLPDGSPNKSIIIKKGEYESILDEIAENGKVSVAVSTVEVNGLLYGVTPILNLNGGLE